MTPPMTHLTDKTKNQVLTIVVATVASIVGGGGGSAFVNASLFERIAKVETQYENQAEGLKQEKAEIEKQRDKLQADLDKVLAKTEATAIYMRDAIMPAITELKVDIATLKITRR